MAFLFIIIDYVVEQKRNQLQWLIAPVVPLTANMAFEGMKQILGLGKKMKLMFSVLSI